MAKVKQMTPWEVPTIYNNDEITGYSLAKEILQTAQANGTTAVLHSRRGVQNFSLDKLVEKLKALSGHELRTSLSSFVSATEYSRNEVVFTFPWGFVRAYGNDLDNDPMDDSIDNDDEETNKVELTADSPVEKPAGTFYCQLTDVSYRQVIAELAESWLDPAPIPVKEEGSAPVFGFSIQDGEYVIDNVGILRDKLIRENYMPNVTEKFDYIVEELNKDEPRGRLILIEGCPGTGKTRMIRSLITTLAESSMCVLVPPSLLDDISGPEFTRCLLRNCNGNTHITLILEDADDCLISREKNEAAKASLSALLNLSDGILGATLNLRIVATTNQELKAIDRAILRPGRLLKRVHVGPLSPERASAVYARLKPEDKTPRVYEDNITLAEVYEDASGVKVIEE